MKKQHPAPRPFASHVQSMKLTAEILEAKKELLQRFSRELRQEILTIIRRGKPNIKTLLFLRKATDKDFGTTVAEELNKVLKDAIHDYADGEYQPVDKAWILTFTSDGKLYRNAKETYCYSIEKPSQRFGIIRALIEAGGYVASDALQGQIGSDSYKSFTDNIASINAKAQGHLKLPAKQKFILGKRGRGYCINPWYTISEG